MTLPRNLPHPQQTLTNIRCIKHPNQQYVPKYLIFHDNQNPALLKIKSLINQLNHI